MARLLPPPQDRFDPITARWVTPGGPLHDPERDSIDPGHGETVELVGPVPPELAEAIEPGSDDARRSSQRERRRWVILGVVAIGVLARLLGGFLIV